MTRLHKKSYDVLSAYTNYLPSTGGLFAIFGFFLVGMLLGGIVQVVLSRYVPQEVLMKYIMVVIYPIQFIPVMLYCSAKSTSAMVFHDEDSIQPLDSNRFSPIGGGWLALMCAVATIAGAIVIEPLNLMLPTSGYFYEMIKQSMEMIAGAPLWVALLTTAVMAPFFEEWMCRGMVLRGLLAHTSSTAAILGSAAFFAIIHLNPWQAVPAFLLGCLFGLVYYKTGSLKLTMLMHCANNSFSILLTKFAGAEAESLYQVMDSKMIYGTIYALSLALVVLFVCKLTKTEFK